MSDIDRKRPTWNHRTPFLMSIFALIILIGGIGGWSVHARISSAVIGKGSIVASLTRQAVQHERGGVVAEIHVENGDSVSEGDLLVTLESDTMRADLKSIEAELVAQLTQEARLRAEIDGSPAIRVEGLLTQLSGHPDFPGLMARQQAQLGTARVTGDQNTRLLEHQINQVRNRMKGLAARISSRGVMLSSAQAEYGRIEGMARKGLIVRNKVVVAQKEVLSIEGEIAGLRAQFEEAKERVLELALKFRSVGKDAQTLALQELNRIQPKRLDLVKKRQAARATFGQTDVRSPATGIVHDLQIQGALSVVRSGQALMYIVPKIDPSLVSVRIDARDIEEVYVEQEAMLRFPAYSKRTTPNIRGRVKAISADAFFDSGKNLSYYKVELIIDKQSLAEAKGLKLVSGMPVDAYITTGERSPLAYTIRPISIYFEKAFRSDG